jgi:hypothetical protein
VLVLEIRKVVGCAAVGYSNLCIRSPAFYWPIVATLGCRCYTDALFCNEPQSSGANDDAIFGLQQGRQRSGNEYDFTLGLVASHIASSIFGCTGVMLLALLLH